MVSTLIPIIQGNTLTVFGEFEVCVNPIRSSLVILVGPDYEEAFSLNDGSFGESPFLGVFGIVAQGVASDIDRF